MTLSHIPQHHQTYLLFYMSLSKGALLYTLQLDNKIKKLTQPPSRIMNQIIISSRLSPAGLAFPYFPILATPAIAAHGFPSDMVLPRSQEGAGRKLGSHRADLRALVWRWRACEGVWWVVSSVDFSMTLNKKKTQTTRPEERSCS